MRLVVCVTIAASLAAPAALAQQTYRTSTGPYGADFSGIEFGPDLSYGFGTSGPYYSSGGAFGGHLGYNLQSGHLLGGVEADALATNLQTGQGGPFSFSEKFLTSLRGKAGYVFGDLMAYGTLGVGWGTTDYANWLGSHGATVDGAVFGVGAEYALTRNVSFRAEYMRYQFGDVTYGGVFPFVSQTVNASTNLLRVGASLHF
jgi:outer membrane immunogenic protein